MLVAVLVSLLRSAPVCAQQPAVDDELPKRIFGIIPNYRTSPTLQDYRPLSVSAKFKVAADDSFDRGMFVLAALFAGEGQLTSANPSFGHGFSAYGRYYVASFADWTIGDFMTEAIYPTVLRQDPRYFRLGAGSGWKRLRYAIGQIIITHGDSGATQVNASELLGNATAVGLSNWYYRDNRTLSANVSKFGLQLGVDMAANIVKEFGPDLARVVGHH
jgi:hypothetical protein